MDSTDWGTDPIDYSGATVKPPSRAEETVNEDPIYFSDESQEGHHLLPPAVCGDVFREVARLEDRQIISTNNTTGKPYYHLWEEGGRATKIRLDNRSV